MKTWWPPSKLLSKVNIIQQKLQGLVLIWEPKILKLCRNKWKINHISNLSPEQRRNKPPWNSHFTIFWIRKALGVIQSKAMPNLSTASRKWKYPYTADQSLLTIESELGLWVQDGVCVWLLLYRDLSGKELTRKTVRSHYTNSAKTSKKLHKPQTWVVYMHR